MMRSIAVLVLSLGLLSGCAASRTSPEFTVDGSRYGAAFDAARDALVAERFELERVDAAAGVITTLPKTTAGLATPWDDEQSDLEQECSDLLNNQERRVRITFEPVRPQGAAPADLRSIQEPIAGHVEVTIYRVRRAGWRLEPTSLRYSAFTQDPELTKRGMFPQYTVPYAQDPQLAARLAGQIEKTLAAPKPVDAPESKTVSPPG